MMHSRRHKRNLFRAGVAAINVIISTLTTRTTFSSFLVSFVGCELIKPGRHDNGNLTLFRWARSLRDARRRTKTAGFGSPGRDVSPCFEF